MLTFPGQPGAAPLATVAWWFGASDFNSLPAVTMISYADDIVCCRLRGCGGVGVQVVTLTTNMYTHMSHRLHFNCGYAVVSAATDM